MDGSTICAGQIKRVLCKCTGIPEGQKLIEDGSVLISVMLGNKSGLRGDTSFAMRLRLIGCRRTHTL
jgi:hypothetical protein